MTSLPNNGLRWMCPLHPDPVLEEKLLPAAAGPDSLLPLLTQRVRLHNLFSGKKVDQRTVQLDFMTKARSGRCSSEPAAASAAGDGRRRTAPHLTVPNAVKQM